MAKGLVRNVRGKVLEGLLALPFESYKGEPIGEETMADVRILADGRVLLYQPPSTIGAVYPSLDSVIEMMRKSARSAPGSAVDLAGALLPPVADFLSNVQARAVALGPTIGVAVEVLDYSVESLKAVDEALLAISRSKRVPADLVEAIAHSISKAAAKRMTPSIAVPLLAYVGEVMRRPRDGRWRDPSTIKIRRKMPVYDPAEMAAWQGAFGSGPFDPRKWVAPLTPTDHKYVDEAITGHDREPMIVTAKGHLLQPFAALVGSIAPDNPTRIHSYVDTTLRCTPVE